MRFMRVLGKKELFFDDVISGQDDVITFRFSMEVEILSWSFGQKKFWVDWTNQLLAEFMTRHPTFQISTSEKTHILRTNPPTKPLFPLSQQRWIRWWSQIWWHPVMERYAFYFFQSPIHPTRASTSGTPRPGRYKAAEISQFGFDWTQNWPK